jgi:hypothetical protein
LSKLLKSWLFAVKLSSSSVTILYGLLKSNLSIFWSKDYDVASFFDLIVVIIGEFFCYFIPQQFPILFIKYIKKLV